ncbi:MAG: NAD-dependent epimerase [Stutzerimonas stutzeri]|nr:MAG: NAD-dependent epimerase [Stutzerimonas stutzeri]
MACHLILGAGGFVARHVATLLAMRGESVRLAARSATPVIDTMLARGMTAVFGDLRDADWGALLQGVDVVHHYAWSTVPSTADRDPLGDIDGNVRPTLALLEAMRARGGGRVLFASSGGTVYGHLRQIPVSEDQPVEPVSIYGVGKATIERYLSVYKNQHNIDARIARLSNPFGVGQSLAGNQGAATLFLHQSMANDPIHIFGDGSVVRDYVHIADAADALVALATLALPPEAPHVFNIGTGVGVSLNEILIVLERCLDRKINIRRVAGRAYDVPINVLDVRRARQWLGWSPQLNFEEGMLRAISDLRIGTGTMSSLNAVRPQ